MGLESATYIAQLNEANPVGGVDAYSTADDHLRLLKAVLKGQFPNLGNAAVNPTAAELNHVVGATSSIQTQLNAKVPSSLLKYCVGLAQNKGYADNVWTDLPCDSADILDVGGWHDPASNPQNFVVPAGIVAVEFQLSCEFFSADATENWVLGLRLQQNGSTKRSSIVCAAIPISNWSFAVNVHGMIAVSVGDILKMQSLAHSLPDAVGASISTAYFNVRAIA